MIILLFSLCQFEKIFNLKFHYLPTATLACESTLAGWDIGLIDGNVTEDKSDILTLDKAVFVEIVTIVSEFRTFCDILHIESELNFRVNIWVVDLEEAMHEFLQINEAVTVQVQYCEKPLTNNSGELRVL